MRATFILRRWRRRRTYNANFFSRGSPHVTHNLFIKTIIYLNFICTTGVIPKFTTIVIVFIYLSWLVDCAGSKRHAVERSVILKEISWLRIFCVKVEWNSFNVWRRMVRIDVKYLREQRQNHKWQAWQPPCDLDPRCRPYFAKLTLWPKLVYISYILMIVFSYVHCLFLYMIW